jgi:hypothetical protein
MRRSLYTTGSADVSPRLTIPIAVAAASGGLERRARRLRFVHRALRRLALKGKDRPRIGGSGLAQQQACFQMIYETLPEQLPSEQT